MLLAGVGVGLRGFEEGFWVRTAARNSWKSPGWSISSPPSPPARPTGDALGPRADLRSGLKPERAKAAQVAPPGLAPPLPAGGFSTETSSAHPSWLPPYLISALIIFWCPGVQSSCPSHSSQALERFCSGIK